MRNEIGRAALKFSTVVGRPSWEEGGADTSLNVEVEFEDGDDGSETKINQIADMGEAAPVSIDEDEEYGNHLATAFRRVTLSDRDRRIFEARYLVANPLTLAELSTELGITGERVRVLARRTESLVLDAAKRSLNLRPENFPQALTYSVFRYRTDENAWRGTGLARSYLLDRTRPGWRHSPLTAEANRVRLGGHPIKEKPARHRIAQRNLRVSSNPRLALIHAGAMMPRWIHWPPCERPAEAWELMGMAA
jgi:hypothetical protein